MTFAFGSLGDGAKIPVSVVGGGNGNSRLQRGDGRIASVQPEGSVEWRPDGADGPYEWCKVSGQTATYLPASSAYVFCLTECPKL